jgi:hypothetical protein
MIASVGSRFPGAVRRDARRPQSFVAIYCRLQAGMAELHVMQARLNLCLVRVGSIEDRCSSNPVSFALPTNLSVHDYGLDSGGRLERQP